MKATGSNPVESIRFWCGFRFRYGFIQDRLVLPGSRGRTLAPTPIRLNNEDQTYPKKIAKNRKTTTKNAFLINPVEQVTGLLLLTLLDQLCFDFFYRFDCRRRLLKLPVIHIVAGDLIIYFYGNLLYGRIMLS